MYPTFPIPEKDMATYPSILARTIPWIDSSVWRSLVHGVKKSQTQLSDWAYTFPIVIGITCYEHFLPGNKGPINIRAPNISVKVKVTHSCPTVCDPMDCIRPGSSVHGILQARILEWVAVPFSRGSTQSRNWTQISLTAGGFFTIWVTREAQ